MIRAAVLAVLLVPAAVIGLDTPLVMADSHLDVTAGGSADVYEGSVGRLNGTVSGLDPADIPTYAWMHNGTQSLGITIANNTALSTTFKVAGNVTTDTPVTFTLTVNDVTSSPVTDTVDVNIQDASGAFIATWATDAPQKKVIFFVSGTDTIIDWGDGSERTNSTGRVRHPYVEADQYRVIVDGSVDRMYIVSNSAQKLMYVDQWGDIEWSSMQDMFDGASNMVYRAVDTPNLSGVSLMDGMFRDASSFNGNISSWNVSAVTDMNSMFRYASSFNQTLNGWDVSAVTNMSHMFGEASSFNQTLNGWDVSAVTDMSGMFSASSFNRPLNNWNVSAVTDMSYMFNGASFFDGDISSWNVSKVTNMESMFSDASSFNQTLNGWDVLKVTDMNYMFAGAEVFNQPLDDWDVSKVTNTDSMFEDAFVFDRPLNDWNVSKVTNMYYMFSGASSFNQPLNNWNVSKVTDMTNMFSGASSFNQPLNDWDVSAVTSMDNMFSAASDFDQNLGNWYVVPDSVLIAWTDVPGVVGTISAQNTHLDGHSPEYNITNGGDHTRFAINGNQLNMISVGTKSDYTVNVTASGGTVFKDGNNWRILDVTVTGQEDRPLSANAGPDQRVLDESTVTLLGTASDSDSANPTYLWTQNPGSPQVMLEGPATLMPTFTAPDVSSDVDLIFTLTVSDGTDTFTDTVTVTVHNAEADFVTTWNDITVGINIPIRSSTGSFTVDWGDGEITEYATITTDNNLRHNYDTSGTYTIHISGNFSEIYLQDNTTTAGKLQSIDQWGDIEWTTMAGAFYGADNMIYNAIDVPDLSSVTDMSHMFFDTLGFSSGDLSGWNISGVTDMRNMFTYSGYTGDLFGWNVSSVTDMQSMFSGASSFDSDLSGWDVSAVNNMDSMFSGATSFNSDLSGWDVSAVLHMDDMFDGATSFEQNLGNWYVVPDSVSIAKADVPGVVGTISAQNTPLNDHSPEYNIVNGGDHTRFAIVNGNQLNMTSVDTKSDYIVNVTASDGTVFEDGNNWRVLDVTVTTAADNTPPVIELDGSATITITVDGTYNEQGAVCDDDVDPDKPATVGGQTVDTGTAGTYTITYDCTDTSNNAATQVTRTVTVEAATDNTPPVIELDGSATITITVDGTYNEQGAVCDDDVDPDKPATVGGQTVDTGTAGTYTITYDCTDTSNNAATQVTRTVTVEAATDNTPPVIELDGSATITITVDGTYNEQGAVCDDDVDPDKPATVGGQTVDTGTAGTYTITYDCTDTSNNAATQVTRTVTVEAATDNTPPVIELDGSATITITVDGTYNEQGAVCDDDVDPDKPATVGGQTVDTGTAGTYTITYDCTDTSNNAATQVTRTVTVEAATDNTPPVIELDGSATITITVDGTYNEQGAVCDDDVDPDKPATVGGQTVDTGTAGTYTITYDCTDTSNNAATQVTRTVTVEAATDNTPPVIELDGSATITITVDGTYNEQGAVCDDDVDPDKPATVGGQTVDTGTAGTYTITYDCTDTSNNAATQVTRTVTVEAATDNTPPVIELDGSATITITVDGTYNEQGAVCDDDVDPDKPATVGGQTVDTGTAGTYTITYDCTDTSNNAATQVTRTVTVEAATDNTPPVIELDGSATITITVDGTYNEQGAVCDDDVDPDKPATVGGQTVDTGTAGTYVITYDCTDTSNNAATQVTRTVTVREAGPDTTPPVIELDGSATITITVDGTYNEQGAVCDDDVDPDKPATVGGQTVDTGTAGTYVITYDCTDTSNNAATQVTRTVTVEAATDNTPPVIELDGSATITITVDGTYNEQGAVCDDDVDPDKPATVGGQTVDTGTAGTYVITYDCTDTSNNAATQVTRTVTVEAATDNTPPVIELDGSATITITVDGTYNEQGAVCDDDVDPDKPATVGGQTVDTGTAGTYVITYDCTDTSNNAATQVTRTVTVEAATDNTPPVIELDGSATITITVDGTYNEQGAVCDDDVDPDKPATVGGQTVDTGTAGTYVITYDCIDTSNNAATQVTRTVTVREAGPDTTAPVITILGSNPVTVPVDTTYNDKGADCKDVVDDSPTLSIFGSVDTTVIGTHYIIYFCSDESNNRASAVRTVIVTTATDNTPPVIELDGSATITITVDGTYNEQGAVCDDDVDPDKPATVGGQTVDTGTAGTYVITYDCTDTSNNAATQVTRTVTVEAATDNTPPVIELDGSATITITVDGTYNEQGAVCDDDVDPDKPATVGGQTVDTGTAGTYVITYDCTDTSNNAATQVTRTVTVEAATDNTPPVIELDGSATITITVDGTYNEQGAVCDDDVDPDKPATVGGQTVDTGTAGTYVITYDCTDTSNNAATQVTRTVTVEAATDNTPPVIELDGSATITITVDGTYNEQGAVCDDDVDPDKPATVGGQTVDTGTAGTYVITYDCTDTSNNAATQVTRTVTVEAATDNTPPVIELDGSATITITVDGTYNEQGAVCDDDVDPDKPATVGGQTVDTGTAGTYVITYDCTDTSNNAATQVTRTVTVEAATDNTPPVIELDGSATITITVDGTYNEQGAVCDDDVDPDKPATVGGQTVDTGTAGTYVITYDCTDTSNNAATQVTRTVTVEAATDNTPPVIELDGSATITITVDGTYNEQGAVCDDDVDPDKPATVGGQTVDTGTAGTYTITYDCTDTSNNVADQVTRTVTVTTAADITAPVIELDGSATITITVDSTYNEQGAVCDDDVDPDKPATVGGQTVDTGTAGTYTITYDCTDTSNNVADQVTRTVTVTTAADTTAPVIELDGPATITITVGGTYNEQGAVCDDDVDPDKPATVGGQTVDTGTAGTYTITYDCTDTSNNVADQVTRTVTVTTAADTTAPVIELDGPATITITVGGTYNEQGAVCDDDVDPDKPATVGGQTVDTGTAGTYTITYDCTDTSNNVADQVTRTVTVTTAADTTAPVIELDGPATITITVGGTYNEQGAVCDDDVDPDKPATVGGQTVDTGTAGTYAVTYSCTDAAGNDATQVSRTVIVQTAVIPDTDRSSKSSRSNNTPNPLTTDNSIIIDGQSYDLGSGTTTTTNPYYITTGQATDLVFTAYSPSDIVRFTIYLNLHGDDIKHSDSDTYIRYDHGVVEIVDPHGFISDASITITEDLEQSRKKIINTLIEFEGNMGLTNMAVYIWNEDRRYTSIRVFNALDITSGTETLPDPEPVESDSGLPADPEPVAPGFEDDAVDPEHTSSDTPWPDDYDDAQVLTLIRMWSGFESEMITDTQLLELLGLEDYQGVDLPDWMMTELGVLVARGDVTVGEFVLALQYVLENIHGGRLG